MAGLSLALDTPDLAAHYDRASVDGQFKFGKQLIELLGIEPGARVLDVGSGTGLLAEHVASLVGASGSVVGVDPLPLRIELAKRKAKPNLSFAVDNAYALEQFEPGSFDVLYLNAVFHWFPEKLAPLRNFHRLLKPGGKLGLSTGSKDHPNRVHDVQQRVLSRAPFAAYSQPEQGLPHLVAVDELASLFKQAAFDVRTIVVETNSNLHSDARAALQHAQASSFGNLLGHLPEDLREQARHEIEAEFDTFKTPEGIRQTGARIVAVAVKR